MTLRIALIFSALASLFVFPAAISVFLALLSGIASPLSVFAIGLLADLLYYAPGTHPLFLCSILGAFVAGIALLVRRFFETSIIGS